MEIFVLTLGELPFAIDAPHDEHDWQNPERTERWADKRQLAQVAQDLNQQGIAGQQAYRLATIAGYTAKEAGYIAKMIRTGDWREILAAPVKKSITELLQEQVYA